MKTITYVNKKELTLQIEELLKWLNEKINREYDPEEDFEMVYLEITTYFRKNTSFRTVYIENYDDLFVPNINSYENGIAITYDRSKYEDALKKEPTPFGWSVVKLIDESKYPSSYFYIEFNRTNIHSFLYDIFTYYLDELNSLDDGTLHTLSIRNSVKKINNNVIQGIKEKNEKTN